MVVELLLMMKAFLVVVFGHSLTFSHKWLALKKNIAAIIDSIKILFKQTFATHIYLKKWKKILMVLHRKVNYKNESWLNYY